MSEPTPEKCPTCMTPVPEGASRCPGCGRVFGEANRCPHCRAIAAVRKTGSATVCAACGKPRAGSTVLGGGRTKGILPSTREGREASHNAMVDRASGRARRGFGILVIAGGIAGAITATIFVAGALGFGLAAAVAVAGVGVGAYAIRSGAQRMVTADSHASRAREAAILELAEDNGGRLTADAIAERHSISLKEADALLTALVGDGSRIGVDVSDDGLVEYVFYEITPAVRVRVGGGEETEGSESEPVEIAARIEDRGRKVGRDDG